MMGKRSRPGRAIGRPSRVPDPAAAPEPRRPFREARSFARLLGLRGAAEWAEYVKGELPDRPPLPPDIPACPNVDYLGEGFVDFDDWLGLRADGGESDSVIARPLEFFQAEADRLGEKLALVRVAGGYVKADEAPRGIACGATLCLVEPFEES
jgi:hypothetical protein